MSQFKVFISYSHQDEWLKDELIQHFGAMKRNGLIDVWHDRLIPPGGILENEIDENIRSSDIILLLISTAFINSNYCFEREYQIAKAREEQGDATIVPIILRYCDWDVGGLRRYNALPRDGDPVAKEGASKTEPHHRDAVWLGVVEGLKATIKEHKLRLKPPPLREEYRSTMFQVENIRHHQMPNFDEKSIFVDPDVYNETKQELVTRFVDLVRQLQENRVSIISGKDRSGKSLLAKSIQSELSDKGVPTVLLSGAHIRNADIDKTISQLRERQFGTTSFPPSKTAIIIDDFEECSLTDKVKEGIVRNIASKYGNFIILGFTSAPSVLFTSENVDAPVTYNIKPLADSKLLDLVRLWCSVGSNGNGVEDSVVVRTYERLQTVFTQTEIDKSPYSAATFLELLDSSSGADIAISSFAGCYEALISNRLNAHGVNWKSFDEAKNFLALVAYKAYAESGGTFISHSAFSDALSLFEDQHLSNPRELRMTVVGPFLRERDEGYDFYEEYLWYFFTARYAVKTLRKNNEQAYVTFVEKCAENVFLKKYANIIIYVSYFSDDNFVLSTLLSTLDGLFSKAQGWELSDRTRELMIGNPTHDQLYIMQNADVSDNRNSILRERVVDLIGTAEQVVASYTLPWLSPHIDDSEMVEDISSSELDANSYMKSVNALMRIHSVIGQILSSRSGTYDRKTVMDCIARMVKASGRYAYLNHAIAAVLFYEREESAAEVDAAIDADISLDEKLERVTKLFAFWSVHFSQSGLARYLAQDHSLRALEKLAEEYESEENKDGHYPFNFTSVLLIANLYHTGKIDQKAISDALEKYGRHSALAALLRATVHMYAYYMPLTIEDKQWLSSKLKMPLQQIEVIRRKAVEKGGGRAE